MSPAQAEQPSRQEEGVHVVRAQAAAAQSDAADSRPEVLQMRDQVQHKSMEPPSPNFCPAAAERQVAQTDVQQQACFGALQAQVEQLKAELSSANHRCNGYEAKLQAARAQYQEQQRRIVALENVVYDLRLHVCQST